MNDYLNIAQTLPNTIMVESKEGGLDYCLKLAKNILNYNGDVRNCIDFHMVETDELLIINEDIADMKEFVLTKPRNSSKKVVLIRDAQKLNLSSQNKLLKTLEEPNENVSIILLVDNRYSLLDTVVSRCFHIKLENDIHSEFDEYSVDFVKAILKKDNYFFISKKHSLKSDRNFYVKIFNECITLLGGIIRYKMGIMNLEEIFLDNKDEIKNISIDKLIKYSEDLFTAIKNIKIGVNVDLILTNLTILLMEE